MLEVYFRNFMNMRPKRPSRTDVSGFAIRTDGWSTLKDKDKQRRKSRNKSSRKARRLNRRR